jgi:putative ABC transport system permease protein
MGWMRRFLFRFLSLFGGERQDQELDEELRFCLENETEEYLRQGMGPDEALRAAHLKIGGLEQVKESCRDQRGFPLLESLVQDIRYGIRQLARNPGLSIVVILLVALGVGASTAIFSVVNAVLLEPLPFEASEQLTMLWAADTQVFRVPVAGLDFLDWRDQSQSFERIVAYSPRSLSLTGNGDPERVLGALVTPGLFELLRVPPMMGRTFEDKQELPGNTGVAIISDSLWQRRFGADPEVLGRSIMLDGEAFTLIGIMPPGFTHPCPWSIGERTEVWRPYPRAELTARGRDSQWLLVMGRLKDGVTRETAEQEMFSISQSLEGQYPDTNTGRRVNVAPLREDLVGRVADQLVILQVAAGIILLIVCSNAAGLLSARATTRRTEIAIRASLGAGRTRLARQMLVENLPFSLLGGGLGILLAIWGLSILRTIVPVSIPRANEVKIDGEVLVFALGVSLLIGFLFSLIPALVTFGGQLSESLKQGRGTSRSGPRHLRARQILVISQFALALMLANGAVLMLQSYRELTHMDHGFSFDNVLTLRLTLQGPRYESEEQVRIFYAQLLDRIDALPGVRHAAAVSRLPLEGGTNSWATIEGRVDEDEKQSVELKTATVGYFQAMGITMLRGRDFVAQDSSLRQPGVVVNQRMAELCWPHEGPLGKRFRFGDTAWLTVVGVVANTRQFGAERQPVSEAYFPYISPPLFRLSAFTQVKYLIVSTENDPLNLVAPIRREVARLDPDQPISEIRTTDQILAQSLARRSFTTLLIGLFAALALILVATGIYGAMSYFVVQRTHEIGVRMALGADRFRVLLDVLRRGLRQALIGAVIGLVGVVASRQLLGSMLYGISPTDPLTLAMVAGLLAGVAMFACYIPGRSATRVNPVEALRYE